MRGLTDSSGVGTGSAARAAFLVGRGVGLVGRAAGFAAALAGLTGASAAFELFPGALEVGCLAALLGFGIWAPPRIS